MPDFAKYVGLPFIEKGRDPHGFDCWGFVRHVLWVEYGIRTPSYTEDYATTYERADIAALIGRESLGWPEIPLAEAQAGDVLILRIQGQPWHCGLAIDPPYFLHAERGIGTVKDRWDSLRWARRILAVHRHAALMGADFAHTAH